MKISFTIEEKINRNNIAGFKVKGSGKIKVEWGDGAITDEIIILTDEKTFIHEYENGHFQQITIYGEILSFDCTLLESITKLNIEQNSSIKYPNSIVNTWTQN